MRNRIQSYSRHSRQRGAALVAAMLIIILITALALIAEMTARSEIKVVTNINKSKKMFFLAEQVVERVLMHLQYDPEGLDKILAVDPLQSEDSIPAATIKADSKTGKNTIELVPRRVMHMDDEVLQPLAIAGGGSNWVTGASGYEIDAAIDPKNYEEIKECSDCEGDSCNYTKCNFRRPYSNSFRVLVKVTDNNAGGYNKVFAAEIQPKSAFDFAYYTQDMAHKIRSGEEGDEALSFCSGNLYPNYNCNTTFHNRGHAWVKCSSPGSCANPEDASDSDRSSRVIGDQVVGDVYIGGEAGGRGRLSVRGKPVFLGEVWWRYSTPYSMATSGPEGAHRNQTSGGERITSESMHPRVTGGIKTVADRIIMFPDRYEDSIWAIDPGEGEHKFLQKSADVSILKTYNTVYGAARILFRHDMDSNRNGVREEDSQLVRKWASVAPSAYPDHSDEDEKYRWGGAVGSAITPSLNNGRVDEDPNEPGYMATWLIPAWSSDWYYHNEAYEKAALYGGTVQERLDKMEDVFGLNKSDLPGGSADDPKEPFATGVRLCGNNTDDKYFAADPPWAHKTWFNPGSGGDAVNHPGEPSLEMYMAVPSQVGDEFKYTNEGPAAAGIIYVRTNAMIGGVLDGTISMFVHGDVIFDHEVEYEKDPLRYPNDVGKDSDQDMLAIFAKGDVIIPNSFPNKLAHDPKDVYLDDWSDAYQSVTMAGPVKALEWDPYQAGGIFAPQGHYDHSPLLDDDGSEDIHALIAAYAYPCEKAGRAECTYTESDFEKDIVQHRVGFYARPRTAFNGETAPGMDDDAFYVEYHGGEGKRYYLPMANTSGPLRVVGSIAQRISGRVSFDYYNTKPSSIDNDARVSTCDRGFSEFAYSGQFYQHELDKTCKHMGHESFEISHDPRLNSAFPPTPWSNWNSGDVNTANQDVKLRHFYGEAAYQVVNWEELDASFNIAVDEY